jgi:predicted MPP superfamily phosphohydrolase
MGHANIVAMRVLIIFAIVLAIFGPFNYVAVRLLTRLHPRRKPIVIALAILCNVMWLFFPILNVRTDFSRFVRAVFGPPWFAWLAFVIVYAVVIALARIFGETFQRRASRVFLWLVLISIPIGYYTALVPLRVEHVPVQTSGGKRLVLIADLHTGLFTRPSRLEQIFRTAAEQHPDAILLAGDLIDDDPHFTPKLLAATRVVPPSIPILATLGNHETYGAPQEHIAQLRGSRIRLLVNEGYALGNVWIAGLSDYAALQSHPELAPNLDAALRGKPADAIPIVVAHQPRAFADAKKHGITLTLVAHTHGGQVGIRPLHWTLAGLFVKYHMGLYREGASELYVNTGTGYWLLPFRLGLTPEITVVEMRGGR